MNLRIAIAALLATAASTLGQLVKEPMEVRLLETPDGRPLQRSLQRDAMPTMWIGVEATGYDPSHVALVVNGLLMDWAENTNGAAPFRASLRWWPWQGNGSYTIGAVGRTWTDPTLFVTSRVLRAEIAGLHYRTPAPLTRVIDLYYQRFGMRLKHPPLARYVARDPALCRWVSAAYIDDKLYEIHLFDDLREQSRVRPVSSSASGSEEPVTRPTGHYKMLVVFLDHGNTDISSTDAQQAALRAAEEMNDRFLRASALAGSDKPLLRIDVSTASMSLPEAKGIALLTPEQIRVRAERDPEQFHLIAQVELDGNGAPGAKVLRGYDGHMGSGVNIWMRIPRLASLESLLDRVLFDNQLNRSFGWTPEWPRGDGGFTDNNPVTDTPLPTLSPLLFGWTDLDGDSVPEIVDLTPYGLVR